MSKTDTFDILKKVVSETGCFQHWLFSLHTTEADTLELRILVKGTNNYKPEEYFPVNHCHPVPHTTYNEKTWRRWIFEQCMRTLTHEVGELLNFNGVRPFAPMHGPGEDPYTIHEWRPETDALTTQDGSLRSGPV